MRRTQARAPKNPGKNKGFKFEKNPNGVTIWYNGRWILDASTIKQTGSLIISTKRSDDENDDQPYFRTTFKDKWYGRNELKLVFPSVKAK